MTLAAGTTSNGLIRQVQKALGEKSQAAQFAPLLYGHNGLRRHRTRPPRPGSPAMRAPHSSSSPRSRGRSTSCASARCGAAEGSPESTVVEILNDDMPFLVDSVMGELQARGLAVRFLLHPIFKTERDKAGNLQALLGPGDQNWNDGHQESYIAIHLLRFRRPSSAISARLCRTSSSSVRVVVADWQPMLQQVQAAIRQLEAGAARRPGGRAARVDRLPALAGGRQLHLPGFARIPLSGDSTTGDLGAGGQSRPRRAARSRACRCCAAAPSWST